MKRLTERDEYGNADIIALSDMMPELYGGLSFSETNALTAALNRLAAYEDTGLEPEKIADLVAPPNIPLTLDELRQMDGEPVWCAEIKRWGIVMRDNIGIIVAFDLMSWCADDELEKLTLYRRKREGVEDGK